MLLIARTALSVIQMLLVIVINSVILANFVILVYYLYNVRIRSDCLRKFSKIIILILISLIICDEKKVILNEGLIIYATKSIKLRELGI